MSSLTLVIVGVVSVLLTAVHVVGGGKACAKPMLDAKFDRVAKLTLYVCWHYISVHLLASGLVLVWVGATPSGPVGLALAALVCSTYVVFAVLFIAIAAGSKEAGAWHKFGQWIPFSAMGVAGLLAVV